MSDLREFVPLKWKYFWLSLVSLILALVLKYLVVGFAFKEDEVARTLEQDIQIELNRIDQFAYGLGDLLTSSSLSDLKQTLPLDPPYPYFIFYNGIPVFWSDYHFVPSYFQLRFTDDINLLLARNGYYVVKKYITQSSEDRELEVFFTLPIFWSPGLENQYLRASFNPRLVRNNYFTILEDPSVFDERNIFLKDRFLFSISFPAGYRPVNPLLNTSAFILSLLALAFLVIFINNLRRLLYFKGYFVSGFLLIAAIIVGLRVIMIKAGFPVSSGQWDLFNARFFSIPPFFPTPFDFIFNAAALGWIVSLIWQMFHNHAFLLFSERKQLIHRLTKLLSLSALSFCLGVSVYASTILFSQGSIWDLNIQSSLNFHYLRIVGILITLFVGFLFVTITHLLFISLFRYNESQVRPFETLFVLLFPVSIGLLFKLSWWPIAMVGLLYYGLIYVFKWPLKWKKEQFALLSYGLIACMAISALGSSGEMRFQNLKREKEIKELGKYLIADGDPYTEFQLDEIAFKIESDGFIRNRLLNPFQSNEVIEQKIRRAYLKNDFDKFDVDVHVFDNQGYPIFSVSEGRDLFEWRSAVEEFGIQTNFRNIYLVPEQGNNPSLQYFSFVNLSLPNGLRVGTVMLELRRKRFFPNTVFPQLLVDRGRAEQMLAGIYDFGVYKNGILIYSGGAFNYPGFLMNTVFAGQRDDGSTLNLEGNIHHFFENTAGGKTVIISYPVIPFSGWMANFSFRFLILVFAVFLGIVYQTAIQYRRNRSFSYARRIQLYLNVAFFLPLIIVSVSTLGRINTIFRNELIDQYHQKAGSAVTNISQSMERYIRGIENLDELEERVLEVSKILETDLNIFGVEGRLFTSSQRAIYESGLLSEFLNSAVFRELLFGSSTRLILNESIGTLGFRTVYHPIRSLVTGEVIGVLGMPFFESATDLQKKQSAIFSNIIITFAVVFILFFFTAYLVSNVLSFPFTYISSKIKNISLTEKNQRLEWSRDDEIGLLVGEYNRMLINLERNKEALARTEKESAWREMAKQVAHEIKNPLTPMKLSLQQLKRIIKSGDTERLEHIDKQVDSLLQQIDNLSDIATSFSAFARMPMPEAETFDLVGLLHETIGLFESDPGILITTDIKTERADVWADKKLLSRIMSNLLINAVQAVDPGRRPEIHITLRNRDEHTVLLSIKDNGRGIPEEIKEKVFLPNFSTKTSGSGLGLAIARHGIEYAKGKIWFDSDPQWGTVFHIELPLQG
jgi:nitrogen fixation/metabolism regulation signal transduction histidine kinase